MYTLKIQNSAGELFELTHNRSQYSLIHVTGLTPPKANINTSAAGTIDGEFYNSARVNMRNIVLTVVIEGDIETNRQHLYRIFPIKSPCTVFFKNENMDVKIDGYVEIVDGDLFSVREQMQISILCPRPFWSALGLVAYELSTTVAMFSFPFSIAATPGIPISEYTQQPIITIHNDGSVPCGFTADIEIAAESQGVSDLTLYNLTTQKRLQIDANLVANDRIRISTIPGSLSIEIIRDGTTYNAINNMASGSSFFPLEVGDNILYFTCTGDADDVGINVTPMFLYAGV